MDAATFDKEMEEILEMGDELVKELKAVNEGSTEEQLIQTAPRTEEEVAASNKTHLEAARASSLAEAKAYAKTALDIFKMLAVKGATGGIG